MRCNIIHTSTCVYNVGRGYDNQMNNDLNANETVEGTNRDRVI